MLRTQIYLTEKERINLAILSKEMEQPQSALIREAIDQFIEKKLHEKRNTKQVLRSAAGLWANREDLPDLVTLRKEFDR